MRRHVVGALLLFTAVLAPTAAWGISYGVPDEGAHPNVAALVVVPTDAETGESLPQIFCTGTLVDRDTVVTAAHCSGVSELFPGAPIVVTFDDVVDDDHDGYIDAGVELLTGTLVGHPDYGTGAANNPYDVGVFQLDDEVRGITPAALPTAGYLDDRAIRKSTFTTVGYGAVRDTNRTARQALGPTERRMRVDQTFTSMTGSWVTFSMNQATGDGGTCYGDSGGPHFLGSVVVSITVTGDAMCKASDRTYRLDTPSARDFLKLYVALP